MTNMYAELYSFPFIIFKPSPSVFVIAAGVSIGSALLGTARAVLRAVRLPPAEAMRPPSPTLFASEGIGAQIERIFDQPTRMIFRQITRFPARSGGTVFGIAMAVGLLVMALQWPDAIDSMLETHFFEAQRQDVTVGFGEAKSSEVTQSLARLPGVLATEPTRSVAARLRSGPRSRREAVQGIPENARLSPVYDTQLGELELPTERPARLDQAGGAARRWSPETPSRSRCSRAAARWWTCPSRASSRPTWAHPPSCAWTR